MWSEIWQIKYFSHEYLTPNVTLGNRVKESGKFAPRMNIKFISYHSSICNLTILEKKEGVACVRVEKNIKQLPPQNFLVAPKKGNFSLRDIIANIGCSRRWYHPEFFVHFGASFACVPSVTRFSARRIRKRSSWRKKLKNLLTFFHVK